MKNLFKILASLFLMTACLMGFEWQTYSNGNNITALTDSDGIFMASTTGGVLLIDPQNDQVRKFVNTDGLGGIQINACAAGNSFFWLGSSSGELSRFNPAFNEFIQFMLYDRDGSPLRINNLYADGSLLWISTNIGVSLFDTERHGGEIRETYRRFGDIPSGTKVEAVTILDNKIWVATRRGIAFAPTDDPNLLDFTHWQSFNSDSLPELPTDMFTAICSQDGMLWALADNYAVRFNPTSDGVEVDEIISASNTIYSCAFSGDSLYLGCGSGLLQVWSDNVLGVMEIDDLSADITAISIDAGDGLILGTAGQGIFVERSGLWSELQTSGPLYNQVVDMAETLDGRLWFAHNNTYISTYFENMWDNENISTRRFISAESDNSGSVWLGTFGGAVWNVFSSGSVNSYDTSNSTLIGNSDPNGLNYIVVHDIDIDSNNVAWFACYRGFGRRAIVFYDQNIDEWGSYNYSGFKSEAKIRAIHSEGNRVWAGFEDDGVYLIEYGDDPFNLEGLQYSHFTRTESLLPSDQVTCLNVDRNGVVWVGTDMGLAYFDPGVDLFIRTILPEGIGPQITAIEFDVRNNMWIGTQSGLAFRASGATEFLYFSTENSDIVDDNINSLHFGTDLKLWVTSAAGISAVSYNIGNVTEIISEVYAYPNPFILSSAEDRVFFNFIDEVEVQIYGLDGSRIKTLLSNTGWDGTNENGEKVSSGMYLFYIQDDSGNNHTGKIAVVRK